MSPPTVVAVTSLVASSLSNHVALAVDDVAVIVVVAITVVVANLLHC